MFRSVCMVMFLVCCRALNLEGLKKVQISSVRICKGHYIWCLASAQATTGSVPVCFAGLLDRGQINPGFSLGIVAFHLLKKGPGRLGFWGFRMADSGPMRPAEHFLF